MKDFPNSLHNTNFSFNTPFSLPFFASINLFRTTPTCSDSLFTRERHLPRLQFLQLNFTSTHFVSKINDFKFAWVTCSALRSIHLFRIDLRLVIQQQKIFSCPRGLTWNLKPFFHSITITLIIIFGIGLPEDSLRSSGHN